MRGLTALKRSVTPAWELFTSKETSVKLVRLV